MKKSHKNVLHDEKRLFSLIFRHIRRPCNEHMARAGVTIEPRYKTWKIRSVALAVCCLVPALTCVGESVITASGSRPVVFTTTTMLGGVVEAVGGTNVNVYVLVPFGMCPGHFDITPREAETLRAADIILFHGFERFMDGLMGGKDIKSVRVDIKGNWMIPEIHKRGARETARILANAFPDKADVFARNFKEYMEEIDAVAGPMRGVLSEHAGKKVISADMNRDFIEWMGLSVIAGYPRDEDISLKVMNEIVTLGGKKQAALVIDNMQSSGRAGRTIAGELKVPLVVLSNFPEQGEESGSNAYLVALSDSCRTVARALENPE